MSSKTRILVMGGGPGGYVAAVRAARNGADVTLVESDNVGGVCLNWGCIPTKVMVSAAELLEKLKQPGRLGIFVKEAAPDLNGLMKRKQDVVSAQIKGIENLLRHAKVELIRGRGRITGPSKAQVEAGDQPARTLEWDRLVLATGSVPLNVPAFPFDGKKIWSSNDALSPEKIPESLLIVGGGVIGCEFACIYAALGTKVTVVEAMSRLLPLPSLDEDCSKVLAREMKKRKIAFYLNKTVESAEESENGLAIRLAASPFLENPTEKDKEPLLLQADKMLVCIGRSSTSKGLGLDAVGVKTDAKGWIEADEAMKTSASNVYAIGDALGPAKVMLAHVASFEGMIAADNATGEDRIMKYDAIPSGVFTLPEVACVGHTEATAQEAGADARADSVLFRTLGKAQVMGEIAGQAKIISNREDGTIIGVHIIGPHATDLIAEGALAVQNKLRVKDLVETIHAHPTLPEIMLEAGLKAVDRALHG